MKLLSLLLMGGLILLPVLAVWRPRQPWMNRCWAGAIACLIGLGVLSTQGDDAEFTRVVSERQAEVQRVQVLEGQVFTPAFQHLMLDGQMFGANAGVEFERGQRVSVRLMRHWLFPDTRNFICNERGCVPGERIDGD